MDRASMGGETSLAKVDRLTVMQSAITPSIAKFSRATSTDYNNFHISNPNPQNVPVRFKGARDFNSTGGTNKTEHEELLRFGKRVNFGPHQSNADILEAHLK